MISIDALKKAFVEAIFPTKCMVCDAFFHPSAPGGEDFEDSSHSVLSDFTCLRCLRKMIPVRSPMCIVCGEVFHSAEGEDHTCEKCIHDPKRFHFARAFAGPGAS